MFLDLATPEPYEYQWIFISTVDRLSPSDPQWVARQVKRATVGNDVAAFNRSEATKVQPPLPAEDIVSSSRSPRLSTGRACRCGTTWTWPRVTGGTGCLRDWVDGCAAPIVVRRR